MINKDKIKGYVAGIVTAILLCSTVTFAQSIEKVVTAVYNNIKIVIDGTEIEPKDANGNVVEPFIIDGTTYLPVRAVAKAVGLDVGWDGATSTVMLSGKTMEKTEPGQATGYNGKVAAEGIEIVKEYQWETDYSGYVAIVIKNTGLDTVQPRVQVSFKDSTGKVVGAKDDSEYGFGFGDEMVFVFSNEEKFVSYEYVVTASKDKYYSECVSKLEAKVSTTDDKAIIQVTNNGNLPAEFVEQDILFKKGDKVVYSDWGYCVDNDSEIKPGMTEMKEAMTYGVKFDSVEVYLKGRCDD